MRSSQDRVPCRLLDRPKAGQLVKPKRATLQLFHFPEVPPQPETVATLKRTIEVLMEKGAIVRNLENLGEKNLPYKISKHNQRHKQGGYGKLRHFLLEASQLDKGNCEERRRWYFLVDFYSPPNIIPSMLDHLSRDIDVIRPTILKHEEEKPPERPCPGILPVTNLESKFSRRKKK
ncbi:unnamed protein product [Ranitomeya imitator]|uniref:Small ribosomal subunit protein bS6m n=1 Tax=Ranitomeya imitator TaxID=111125 RepID=A0ABN9LZH3_9NEOB|nr:unnamed protein product [Ranitomeya imitator]